MLKTRLASRIDALAEDGQRSVAPLRRLRREPRAIGGDQVQAADEPVAEVIGDVEPVGRGEVAGRVEHADAAGGNQTAGFLIVRDAVGIERVALVEHLHVADRGDDFVVEIVDQLVGLKQHAAVCRVVRQGIPVATDWPDRLGNRRHAS